MTNKPTNQFIESQQELGREQLLTFYDFGNDGNFYFHPEKLDTLINQIIQNTGEELLRRAEGEKKDIPTRQIHWLKTINKTNRRYARKKAEAHNQAIDTLKKHITSITGVE